MRAVRQQGATFLLKNGGRTVHHRESSGAVWRAWMVDGSLPGLSRQVLKTPATITRRLFTQADRRKRTLGRVSGASGVGASHLNAKRSERYPGGRVLRFTGGFSYLTS